MNWFLRILLLSIVFVAALIATMPLSFALKLANSSSSGLTWEQAQGSVWNGQLVGLRFGRQPIGTARLSLKPGDLLAGRMAYDLALIGPVGRGRGQLKLELGNKIEVSELNIRSNISAIVGLSDEVRALGGTADLVARSIIFQQRRCEVADGRVITDVLTLAGNTYGRNWPQIEGEMSCENGMLTLPINAETPSGESIEIRAEIGLARPSSVYARIAGVDAEIETALALVGFQFVDNAYEYRRETSLMESF